MPSDPSAETPTDSPEELHFAYTETPPCIESLDVKTVHADELAGTPAAFAIIGESHYVGVPALGFHEVCSCEPLAGETVRTVSLEPDTERSFSFDSEGLAARTRVATRNLDDFPGPDPATVSYRFGPEAWTTIRVDETAYETYHTYPEYGVALYTETRLDRSPETAAEAPDSTPADRSTEDIPATPRPPQSNDD